MHADSRAVHAWRAALLVALPVLVLLAYWPGVGGGYVLDDVQNIIRNAALHVRSLDADAWLAAAFSSPASLMQRPLAMLTFAANHYFTGLDPVPMKLTNIAIHALNALLVLGLARQLLALSARDIPEHRRDWSAAFVATAWALHPINLTAVLYVVQRMESLAHTFVFAGLLLYLAGRRRQLAGERHAWGLLLAGLLPCTALGLLAKESAVLLPLYAFLVELCVLGFRDGTGRRDAKLVATYLVVLLVPALLGLAWLLPGVTSDGALAIRDFTLAERLMTEPRVVLDYLRWSLLPDLGQMGLYHDDYPLSRGLLQPPSTVLAMLAIAALAGAALLWRARRPLVALGLLWFLGAQLLTATVIPLELVYEHRNYFASLGIALVLGDLLLSGAMPRRWRLAGMVAASLVLLAFGAATHLRAREWSSPVRFHVAEAAKHPGSPRATMALAATLVQATGYRPDSQFLPAAWQALAVARDVPGSGIAPHRAALVLAARTGTLDEHRTWWGDMRQRLRTQPLDMENINALILLTECAESDLCRFPAEEMLATYEAGLRDPPDPVVLAVYGKYALHVLGDTALALDLWRRAAASGDVDLRYNLVRLLVDLGRDGEAREEIARLRRSGRFGQHEAMAAELEQRLDRADRSPRK